MTRLSLEERQEEPKKYILQLSRLSVEINGLCMQVYGEQQNTLWQLVWHFVWFLQWMLTLSIWAKNWVELIFHQVELSWVFESFIPMIPIYYPEHLIWSCHIGMQWTTNFTRGQSFFHVIWYWSKKPISISVTWPPLFEFQLGSLKQNSAVIYVLTVLHQHFLAMVLHRSFRKYFFTNHKNTMPSCTVTQFCVIHTFENCHHRRWDSNRKLLN